MSAASPASTTAASTAVTHPTPTEMVLTRTFAAPRARVWRAWTDPTQVVKWWGPTGFTTTIEKWEHRVGGVRKYVMHGPDGANYPNSGVYTELVELERMVWRHGGAREGGPGVSFTSTVTFEDAPGGGTLITLRMNFPDAEHKQMVLREYGAEEGGRQTLARLADFFAAGNAEASPFNIERTFNFPLERVWRAWTDPTRLALWWGPKGVTSTIKSFELRPGGVWHCRLQAPGQPPMWGKYTYREIIPMRRLVFTVSFSDEAGNLIKHPMSADWPLVILSEVDFAESGGRTTIKVRWTPVNPTDVERRTFEDGASSMTMGWTGTFDQFEAYMAAESH